MQESDNNDLVLKLASREKQLTEMAEMLADLNENLNDVLIANRTLIVENKDLQQRLTSREEMLRQELKDKELIFSKLQTLERENERLKEKVNNLQGKANAGAEMKKPNINKTFAIETSHGKIQMNTLNNEQSPQQNKNSPYNVTSPQQLVNMELKKQDSSGSEKTNEDEEDVLARIRKNLGVEDPSS